jgi:hypothetical protein
MMDQFGRIWKEAMMVKSKNYLGTREMKLRRFSSTLFNISGAAVDIWTRHLLNTSEKH